MRVSTPQKMALLSMLLTLGLCLSQGVNANGFHINAVSAERQEDVYYLEADIHYALSDDVREALFNGVSLEFEIDAKVIRLRPWLWNETILSKQRRYALRYRALSKYYQVIDLSSDETTHFKTLPRALEMLGQVSHWPLVHVDQLTHKELYQIKVRCRLDVGALPPPLQSSSLFSSDWQLTSDWFVWRLNY